MTADLTFYCYKESSQAGGNGSESFCKSVLGALINE
jgi:hypothetical protein